MLRPACSIATEMSLEEWIGTVLGAAIGIAIAAFLIDAAIFLSGGPKVADTFWLTVAILAGVLAVISFFASRGH